MPAMLDNMVLSYLVEAMDDGYDPEKDDEALGRQRLAALRLFLWAEIAVGETAVEQSQRTRDESWREKLGRLTSILVPELVVPEEGHQWLARRTDRLGEWHNDPEDCRIVAEAEGLRALAVVTFDKTLKKKLAGHAELPILFPSEYWERLNVAPGTPPRWTPHPSNPLADKSWWPW
jgi:hypothetical protein